MVGIGARPWVSWADSSSSPVEEKSLASSPEVSVAAVSCSRGRRKKLKPRRSGGRSGLS